MKQESGIYCNSDVARSLSQEEHEQHGVRVHEMAEITEIYLNITIDCVQTVQTSAKAKISSKSDLRFEYGFPA